MELLLISAAVVQNMSISLGVGASTLAIINFFVAIADGTIDQTEHKMMNIVYQVLKVTMVLILTTTLALFEYSLVSQGLTSVTPFMLAQLSLVGVLFINSILMTRRLMPSSIGPALQAGSWYTLGIITALVAQGLSQISLMQFGLGYLALVLLAISLVNGVMAYQKSSRRP